MQNRVKSKQQLAKIVILRMVNVDLSLIVFNLIYATHLRLKASEPRVNFSRGYFSTLYGKKVGAFYARIKAKKGS